VLSQRRQGAASAVSFVVVWDKGRGHGVAVSCELDAGDHHVADALTAPNDEAASPQPVHAQVDHAVGRDVDTGLDAQPEASV